MIMAMNLTQGAITRICINGNPSDNIMYYKPVLQVIVSCQSCCPGIFWLSDGSRYTPGILVPKLEELITSRKLQQGSIVKLTNFIVDKVQNHMVINILDLEVILDKYELIGEPIPLTEIAPSLPNVADLRFSNWMIERMTVNLTQGAVAKMNSDYSQDDEFMPVLQVIDVSQLFCRRILLSDGWNFIVGIFLWGLEELDYSTRLQKGTIVKLTEFCVKKIHKDQKTLIIIDLDVIEDKCELIGNPVSLPKNEPCSQFASAVDSNSCKFNQFVRIPSPIEEKARINVNLTQGAIMRICGDNLFYLKEFKPVLQVFEFQNGVIFLSDGSHYMRGFLSKICEHSVRSKKLQKGSIVKINRFIVREELQNQKMIGVLDLVILEECVLVGEPKPVPLPINAPSPLNMSGLSIS